MVSGFTVSGLEVEWEVRPIGEWEHGAVGVRVDEKGLLLLKKDLPRFYSRGRVFESKNGHKNSVRV